MFQEKPDDLKRLCHFCEKPLEGRADQRFCNDDCRSAARRLRKKREKWDEPYYIPRIHRILQRNHQIIENQLRHENPATVSKSLLLELGFDFRFFTSNLQTRNGTYHFCYAFGWKSLDNGKILLVENFDQVDI